MSFTIQLRIEAQIDLDEIFVWYEEQKPDLGFAFIYEFERKIYKISGDPYHASYILNPVRRVSLQRFPYYIAYLIDETNSQIIVLAVDHYSRNPEWFRKRLKE